MLLPPLRYVRPASLEEALAALAEHDNARVLAGGQTLVNALKLRLAAPDVLVDVSRLDELRRIRVDEDGTLRIGAAVTYDEVAASEAVRARQPRVASMSSRIVDRQVRARGTVGGNVALADPTSNYPPLLVALDGRVVVAGRDGAREHAADAFFHAPFATACGPGEIVTEVLLPALSDGEGVGYEHLLIGTDSWALARAVAWVRTGERVEDVRVVAACGPVPLRQPAVEAALRGRAATDEAIAHAAQLVGDGFDPPADVHASAEFRTELTKVMVGRALRAAVAAGRGG